MAHIYPMQEVLYRSIMIKARCGRTAANALLHKAGVHPRIAREGIKACRLILRGVAAARRQGSKSKWDVLIASTYNPYALRRRELRTVEANATQAAEVLKGILAGKPAPESRSIIAAKKFFDETATFFWVAAHLAGEVPKQKAEST